MHFPAPAVYKHLSCTRPPYMRLVLWHLHEHFFMSQVVSRRQVLAVRVAAHDQNLLFQHSCSGCPTCSRKLRDLLPGLPAWVTDGKHNLQHSLRTHAACQFANPGLSIHVHPLLAKGTRCPATQQGKCCPGHAGRDLGPCGLPSAFALRCKISPASRGAPGLSEDAAEVLCPTRWSTGITCTLVPWKGMVVMGRWSYAYNSRRVGCRKQHSVTTIPPTFCSLPPPFLRCQWWGWWRFGPSGLCSGWVWLSIRNCAWCLPPSQLSACQPVPAGFAHEPPV